MGPRTAKPSRTATRARSSSRAVSIREPAVSSFRLRPAVAVLAVAAIGATAFAPAMAPTRELATTADTTGAQLVVDTLPVEPGDLLAGVATVDATWHVGAAAGQYADIRSPWEEPTGDIDPSMHATLKARSSGVQSRLTIRALVLDDGEDRVALVKSDNYLAQDQLLRRVAAILAEGDSGITHDQILHSASHNHSSAYYTTPAVGVWVFEDVFDLRMFEYQARAMASAIEEAAGGLAPARLGATTVEHHVFKGNISGPTITEDGSPGGYPREFGDKGLVVMRVDTLDGGVATPLATWVNWGQHPESLDSYGLMTADFLAPLERFVAQDTGTTLVFSQADVGSAEGPYTGWNRGYRDDGTLTAWGHVGFAQTDRGARLLADSVVEGFDALGRGEGDVPFRTDVDVEMMSTFVSLPYSQPLPGVSNCRTEPTLQGDPGAPVLGLPDCARPGNPSRTDLITENLKEHGIPVPASYAAPSYGAVEESARLLLQVVQLGDVLLASCACEAQVDLILNLESRLNDVADDQWDGFDWSTYGDGCTVAEGTASCSYPNGEGRITLAESALQKMLTDVHGDPEGWDAAANTLDEMADRFPGNFTRSELAAEDGFEMVVGLGHTGDYNGYTVSYREFVSRDHYRKALTCCGPHTADYMVTRLLAMVTEMRGGPAYAGELHDEVMLADEARAVAFSVALGAAASAEYDAWQASLADDAGTAEITEQPASIGRFETATLRWVGGSNALDNPVARVEREVAPGVWETHADASGGVPTGMQWPQGVAGLADAYTGSHVWEWYAAFEAYVAGPDGSLPSTPTGSYRFVIDGVRREGGADVPYTLTSDVFEVAPWTAATDAVTAVTADATGITVELGAVARRPAALAGIPLVDYPRTSPSSPFDVIGDDDRTDVCKTCSFGPWAFVGEVVHATVSVAGATHVARADATSPQTLRAAVPGVAPGTPVVVTLTDAAGNTATATFNAG